MVIFKVNGFSGSFAIFHLFGMNDEVTNSFARF